MTDAFAASTTVAPAGSRRRFVHHYFEMTVVMLVSMMVLSGLFWGIMAVLGHSDLRHFLGVRTYAQIHRAYSS